MGDVRVNVDNVSKRFGRSLKRSLWAGLQDVAMAGEQRRSAAAAGCVLGREGWELA